MSIITSYFGKKIPAGHLYFSQDTYTPQRTEGKEGEKRPPINALRLYVDQQSDDINGKRLHGVQAFGFSHDKTHSLLVYPEHSTIAVSHQLDSMGFEFREVEKTQLPARALIASVPRNLKKRAAATGVSRDDSVKVLGYGRNPFEVNRESTREFLQDGNLLQIGPEFMSHEEWLATLHKLADKGFVTPENLEAMEIFGRACQHHSPDDPKLKQTLSELLAVYDKQHGASRAHK